MKNAKNTNKHSTNSEGYPNRSSFQGLFTEYSAEHPWQNTLGRTHLPTRYLQIARLFLSLVSFLTKGHLPLKFRILDKNKTSARKKQEKIFGKFAEKSVTEAAAREKTTESQKKWR